MHAFVEYGFAIDDLRTKHELLDVIDDKFAPVPGGVTFDDLGVLSLALLVDIEAPSR